MPCKPFRARRQQAGMPGKTGVRLPCGLEKTRRILGRAESASCLGLDQLAVAQDAGLCGGRRRADEPEINLIPFIDVLLVVLIFLMLSTTYGRLTQIDLKLPNADAAPQQEKPNEIRVLVSSDGHYVVQKKSLEGNDIQAIGLALAAAAKETANPLVVISADARASHQSVIQVLEAAQNAGLQQVTFTAQSRSQTTVLP